MKWDLLHSKRIWRIISQIVFLAIFLFLFRKTDYNGTDQIPYAVNLIFRIDPLIALSVMLAAKTVVALLLLSLITVGLTLLLGRFFCNWVCPMGTLLDFSHRFIRSGREIRFKNDRKIKHVLLVLILISALFSVPLVGYFDPFSILVRGITLALDPALKTIVSHPFDMAYTHGPEWLSRFTEPVNTVLKKAILPYSSPAFSLALISALILAGVFALEKLQRRFWCKNLCPLGALLSWISRYSLLRGHSQGRCEGCGICRSICRMNAINADNRISPMACTLCLDCVDFCPSSKITFRFKNPVVRPDLEGISRRAFIETAATGLIVPAILGIRPIRKNPNPLLIRPPGAVAEDEFLSLCVRCGECMKVCIGNALHPAFLQAGVEGLFSPVVIPRIGYCEFVCTLCGQVCPTGALKKLSKTEKQKVVIGRAYIDRNRCLPFSEGIPCIVCEEHCPTPDKAIKFHLATVVNDHGETVTVKQPYVIDELCIGCGICETKCPVTGRSAIIVTRAGETRHETGEAFVPGSPYGY